MGHLSTHVLDTAPWLPGGRHAGHAATRRRRPASKTLRQFTLNADGRNDGGALLDATTMAAGRYRLVFEVAPYFRARGA